MLPACSRGVALARPSRPWRHGHTMSGAVVRTVNLHQGQRRSLRAAPLRFNFLSSRPILPSACTPRILLQSAGQEAKEATTSNQDSTRVHDSRMQAVRKGVRLPAASESGERPVAELVPGYHHLAHGGWDDGDVTRTHPHDVRRICIRAYRRAKKGGRGKSRKAIDTRRTKREAWPLTLLQYFKL